MIKVTGAITEDVYGIRRVQRLTWLETYPNEELGITREDVASRFVLDDTEEGKKKMEERKKRLADPNAPTWVAKDGDEVIGFCIASKGDENRVGAIYLLPEYQGQGIGRKLMETALSWLGDEKDIYIDVASYNHKAIRFYEKFGFTPSGRDISNPVAALPSGKTIPEIEMVKHH
jgi:GNAT superfamily N-acetyltransferase